MTWFAIVILRIASPVTDRGWARWVSFHDAGCPDIGPGRPTLDLVEEFQHAAEKVRVVSSVRPDLNLIECLTLLHGKVAPEVLASFPALVNNLVATDRTFDDVREVVWLMLEDHEVRKRIVWAKQRAGF